MAWQGRARHGGAWLGQAGKDNGGLATLLRFDSWASYRHLGGAGPGLARLG